MAAVNQALGAAPENPELFYLKAQLLARQGAREESVALFNQALTMPISYPNRLRTHQMGRLYRRGYGESTSARISGLPVKPKWAISKIHRRSASERLI